MKRRHLAILDGDDTLWSLEGLYDEALDQAQELLDEHHLPGDRWRVLQRQRDLVNVVTMGTSAERFPLSSIQALDDVLADMAAHPEEAAAASTFAPLRRELDAVSRSVFTATAPLVPAAEDVVRDLREEMVVVLLTKGDEAVQRRRVEDSGLEPLLDDVVIVDHKTSQTFVDVARSAGIDPERTWSIGNSIPSDINPAVAAGMRAVWIDSHVWEYERREEYAPHPDVLALPSLKVVPEHLLPLLREPVG